MTTRAEAHTCHWNGCQVHVPPKLFMCKSHWFKLPKALRDRVWDAYVPGQEQRLDPSDDYLAVAHEVQAWIEEHYGGGASSLHAEGRLL